jgi:hypothetical protein
VVGRYDILEFTLLARQPGYSELAVRVHPIEEKGKANQAPPVTVPPPSQLQGWSDWPVFAARVPISIRHSRMHWLLVGARVLAGILGIWWAAGPNPPAPEGVFRLIGTLVAFATLGEYLKKFLEAREGLDKWIPGRGGTP